MKRLLFGLFFPLLLFAQAPNNARMLTGVNAQTGTTYTFVAADTTRVVTFNNANPVAVSLPNGAAAGFGPGNMLSIVNLGAGQVTITCASCTINGLATLALSQNQGADIYGGAGTPAVNYVAVFSPSGVGASLSGNNTFTGNNTFKSLNNIRFADQFPGGDCGAKINAADTDLGALPGTIIVNSNCGLTWTTQVSVGVYHTLALTNSGLGVASLFTASAGISLDGQGASLTCWMQGKDNCAIQEAAGANLPWLVRMNTGNFNNITWVTLDGNKANNPTGGVVVLNKGQNSSIWNSTIQFGKTHGLFVSSTSNQAVAAQYVANTVTGNGADGIFSVLTADNFLSLNQVDVNGSTGTVNTQNGTTGGCAANCVTWASGAKWSTDSSLVGTYININAVQYLISSIQSTTVLTLTTAPGSQTGVTYGLGAAIELQNSPTWRIDHNDIGAAYTGGILIYGTFGAAIPCWQHIIEQNQFGSNNWHDIEIHAYDTVGGGATCIQQQIIGNEFIGMNATGASVPLDHIKCFDCSGGLISGNMFNGHIAPNQQRAAMEFTETASGRAGTVDVAANSFQDNAYTVDRYIDSTANGVTRQQVPVSSLSSNGSTCLDIYDTNSADSGTRHSYLCKDVSGNLTLNTSETFNNGLTVPTGQIANVSGSLVVGQNLRISNPPQNFGGTTTQTVTLKKGSGSGNYSNASTTYVVVDASNLCYTVTVPTGWKVIVDVQAALGSATAPVQTFLALTDNAACSTANAGILNETEVVGETLGNESVHLAWVLTGDGNAHNLALQYKTTNGADAVTIINSSSTLTPTMVFTLLPAN